MDNQQPVFPKDFFKQFKDKEEFQSFFNQLFKQGVEEMLRGELDEHLGYQKHRPPVEKTGNSRNGSYRKTPYWQSRTEPLWFGLRPVMLRQEIPYPVDGM